MCNRLQDRISQNKLVLAAAGLSIDTTNSAVHDVIPEPPKVPEGTEEIVSQLNALGEPTFSSMGMGGWSPVGITQNCFEFLHVNLGIEWWGVIAIGMFKLLIIYTSV